MKAGTLATNPKTQAKKAVTKLVDTLSVNTMKEQAEIEVPDVKWRRKVVKSPSKLTAGMYDLDNIKTVVNSSFKDKYSDYVVTTARLPTMRRKFIFVLERQ